MIDRRFYLGKYPPPEFPPSREPAGTMGVETLQLIPDGFQNGAIGPDEVFYLLDDCDAARVRALRAEVADYRHHLRVFDELAVSLSEGLKA